MPTDRRGFVSVLVAAACAAVVPSVPAQDAPRGPIRMLVGFAPGGGSDILARLLADKLKDSLGQPVIVENKPGAGGRIAAEALKAAAGDGTTMMLAPIVVPVLAPIVYPKLAYDPDKDLVPISQVSNFQFGVAVNAAHPARTLADLVAWLKANPAKANFGSPAPGSLPHFFGILVGRAAGVDMTHVAYRGGAPMINDLLGGQIALGVDTTVELIELHRAGKLRILATTGGARWSEAPEVPTFAEAGMPQVDGNGWYAVYGAAGMPRAQVDRVQKGIAAAIRMPEVRERMLRLGLDPTGTTPEELAALMKAETARWTPVIKASGFKPE